MQNKSLMFQVCMVLFMLLVAPVKGLAQGRADASKCVRLQKF